MLKVLLHMQQKLLKTWAITIVKKLLVSDKKSTIDAIKTVSKRVIQKTAEATSDLIGSKIADRVANISKSPKELYSFTDERETETPRERCISPEKRQQIIDQLRIV